MITSTTLLITVVVARFLLVATSTTTTTTTTTTTDDKINVSSTQCVSTSEPATSAAPSIKTTAADVTSAVGSEDRTPSGMSADGRRTVPVDDGHDLRSNHGDVNYTEPTFSVVVLPTTSSATKTTTNITSGLATMIASPPTSPGNASSPSPATSGALSATSRASSETTSKGNAGDQSSSTFGVSTMVTSSGIVTGSRYSTKSTPQLTDDTTVDGILTMPSTLGRTTSSEHGLQESTNATSAEGGKKKDLWVFGRPISVFDALRKCVNIELSISTVVPF